MGGWVRVQVAEVSSHLFDMFFFYLCDAVIVAYILYSLCKISKGLRSVVIR